MRVELLRRGDDEGERDERVLKLMVFEVVVECVGLCELVDVFVYVCEWVGD